jgi:hypothetical protein
MKFSAGFFFVCFSLICFLPAITIHAQVSTTFDSDLEGWEVTGDNSAAWEATTGNPGGCLSVNDWATGPLNWAVAPIAYHGDWSGMTALDSLSAEIYHSTPDPDDYPPEYIFRIAGPGGAAHVYSGASYQPVKDVWNRYVVSLDSVDWTIEYGAWSDILDAVNSLRVMGEFTTGPETCRIDNINLSSTPSYVYVPCAYDDFNGADTGDWSFAETDGATNPGNTGNGGGYVQIDDGTGISKAFAPSKFLGDWSGLDNNGYLTIDLRIISRPSTNLGVGEFIRLSGPGGIAHVDLDPADLPESKYIWKTFVYPLNSTVWTLDSGTWSGLLANVTECRITVEFYDGGETVGFDNFGRMENGCPQIDYPVQIYDPNVSDCGYHSFVSIASVALNPRDGLLYGLISEYTGSGGGIYPVTGPSPGIRMQAYDRPTHLIFEEDGDGYISEIYDGVINRLEWLGSSSVWISGFHAGEPDPCGMAFAPPGFTTWNAYPGDIFVADKGSGSNALDAIFSFSPDSVESERLVLHVTSGDVDWVDIATGRIDTVFFCSSNTSTGLYLLATDTIGSIYMNLPVDGIVSIVYDSIEDDIYIAGSANNTIYRVEPSTGDVTAVASGFSNFLICCLEIDTARRRLLVTDNGYNRVYSFCLGDPTSIDERTPHIANDRLMQVFPNPFNPSATIRFELARVSNVRLDIFDVSGRRVRTLLDKNMGIGIHEIVWDGRNARQEPSPSGVYFIRIVTEDYTETGKMVLIK